MKGQKCPRPHWRNSKKPSWCSPQRQLADLIITDQVMQVVTPLVEAMQHVHAQANVKEDLAPESVN